MQEYNSFGANAVLKEDNTPKEIKLANVNIEKAFKQLAHEQFEDQYNEVLELLKEAHELLNKCMNE